MEWQPIETAPKDGTPVLLAGGQTSENDYLDVVGPRLRRPVVGMWTTYWDEGSWSFAYWDGGWRSGYDAPTHWMPLPEPPMSPGDRPGDQ